MPQVVFWLQSFFGRQAGDCQARRPKPQRPGQSGQPQSRSLTLLLLLLLLFIIVIVVIIIVTVNTNPQTLNGLGLDPKPQISRQT